MFFYGNIAAAGDSHGKIPKIAPRNSNPTVLFVIIHRLKAEKRQQPRRFPALAVKKQSKLCFIFARLFYL